MVTFKKLWESHPQVTGDDNPCSTNGKPNLPDQCAIRVGTALAACGVKTSSLPGVRHCWHHEKSSGHVLAAEELANGLKDFPIPGVKKFIKVEPSDFKSALNGKKGIIFFKGYWQRTVNGKKGVIQKSQWRPYRFMEWFSLGASTIYCPYVSKDRLSRARLRSFSI